jgi:hypothetical protein
MRTYYGEKVHEGTEAIVVAMDIGMTQSEPCLSGRASLIRFLGAASFAYFSPGRRPEGQMVFYHHSYYLLSHLGVRLLIGPAKPIGVVLQRSEFTHKRTGKRASDLYQTPSMISYRNGAVKACGVEAVQDFEEHAENVAYWFKVIVYSAIPNSCSNQESDCDQSYICIPPKCLTPPLKNPKFRRCQWVLPSSRYTRI